MSEIISVSLSNPTLLILEFDTYDRYGSEYVPKGRKMRAQWTPEMAQDLEAYHGIDAEAELTALLTEEIDREIINELLNPTVINENFGQIKKLGL